MFERINQHTQTDAENASFDLNFCFVFLKVKVATLPVSSCASSNCLEMYSFRLFALLCCWSTLHDLNWSCRPISSRRRPGQAKTDWMNKMKEWMKELCCHVIICHQGTGSQPASRQQLFRLSDNQQTKKTNEKHFPFITTSQQGKASLTHTTSTNNTALTATVKWSKPTWSTPKWTLDLRQLSA